MPDLTGLPSLLPGLIGSLLASKGEQLTEQERLYYRVFIRLTDKAVYEYTLARKAVLEEIQRTESGQGFSFLFLQFTDHIENCINTCRRLHLLLNRVNEENGGLATKRVQDMVEDAAYERLRKVRNHIQHLEQRIHDGKINEGIIPSFTDDDKCLTMLGHTISFCDLADILKGFNDIGRDWMSLFAFPRPKPLNQS